MLTLKALTVKNFGPFKGEQIIRFSEEPGVTIVFGENGRGKTTLLNAFRYAFFGSVKARAAQQITLLDMINIEARDEGDATSTVTLAFEHEGHNYELTRTIAPRAGVESLSSDFDLVRESWLSKDGNVMAQDAARDEVARLMPEQVSRFFLFDGELLQEYEELLRSESSMGAQIKESIERILGLPVLTNARHDLQDLLGSAQRQESRAATQDQRVQQYQASLEEAIAAKDEHQRILEERKAEKRTCEEARAATIVEMQRTENLRSRIDQRNQVEREIGELTVRIGDRETRLQEAMSDSWKALLAGALLERKPALQQEYEALLEQKARHEGAVALLSATEESATTGACVTCGRELDGPSRAYSDSQLSRLRTESENAPSESRIQELRESIAGIDRIASSNRADLIREISDNLDDDRVTKVNRETRLAELRDLTRDAEEGEISRLTQEDRRLTQELTLLERAIASEETSLSGTLRQIEQIEATLDRIGGADLAKERRQRDLCSKLHRLFSQSVDLYRDRLRDRVQDAASDVFRSLTNDPDYVALAINDNYGLSIVHETGQIVKVRSAGNEHVVALSLMAALQRNAPLKGPIIMDSPFGRLDQTHKMNVVKALPSMAEQVVLLVYESEVDPQQARNALTGRLREEYRMRRVSSFNTQIGSSRGAQ